MEEYPTEYPQQTEDSGTGSGDGSGSGSTGTGTTGSGSTGTGSGTGTSGGTTGSGSFFLNFGGSGTGSGSGSGSIFDAVKKLLGMGTTLAMTAPKPKVEEEKKEEVVIESPSAPIAANNAKSVQPWMWYAGGAVLGLIVVGGIIWYKRR